MVRRRALSTRAHFRDFEADFQHIAYIQTAPGFRAEKCSHTLRGKSTEIVQNISGQHFAQTLRTQGSTDFCTCFLWYFVQSLMDTTENMYRHSVLSPYSIFCAFSVLKHGIFSSDIWSSKVGSCLCCRSQMTLHFALWSYFTSFGPLRLNCETVRESLNALTGTFY